MKKLNKMTIVLFLFLLPLTMVVFSCASAEKEKQVENAPPVVNQMPAPKNRLFNDNTIILGHELSPFNPQTDPSMPSPSTEVMIVNKDGQEVRGIKLSPSINNGKTGVEYRLQIQFIESVKLYSYSKVVLEWYSNDAMFEGSPYTIVSFFTEKAGSEVGKSILATAAPSPISLDFVANETGWTSPKLADSSYACVGLEVYFWVSDNPDEDLSKFDGLTFTSITFQ